MSKEHERKKDKLGAFMCKILRHSPEEFGLTLDERGQCLVEDLIFSIQKEKKWSSVTKEDILEVVATCSKQRYEINGELIRARYGHSIFIVPDEESLPPKYLFHGTNQNAVQSILETGISPMNRQYVHLSETHHFATLAGKRRGTPILLKVDALKAKELGSQFYYGQGEVWLSTHIPKECIVESIHLEVKERN